MNDKEQLEQQFKEILAMRNEMASALESAVQESAKSITEANLILSELITKLNALLEEDSE